MLNYRNAQFIWLFILISLVIILFASNFPIILRTLGFYFEDNIITYGDAYVIFGSIFSSLGFAGIITGLLIQREDAFSKKQQSEKNEIYKLITSTINTIQSLIFNGSENKKEVTYKGNEIFINYLKVIDVILKDIDLYYHIVKINNPSIDSSVQKKLLINEITNSFAYLFSLRASLLPFIMSYYFSIKKATEESPCLDRKTIESMLNFLYTSFDHKIAKSITIILLYKDFKLENNNTDIIDKLYSKKYAMQYLTTHNTETAGEVLIKIISSHYYLTDKDSDIIKSVLDEFSPSKPYGIE